MSCYIYFYLKKKDTPIKDWKLCLAHLCTSDARELSGDLSGFSNGETYTMFLEDKNDPMYGNYSPLSQNLLDNTIAYYDYKIQEMKDSKVKYEKELQEAKENYLKASSKVILDDIKETISTMEEMYSWCDEEIERFSSLRSYILDAVQGVFEENTQYSYNQETKEHHKKNDYELVYYMG